MVHVLEAFLLLFFIFLVGAPDAWPAAHQYSGRGASASISFAPLKSMQRFIVDTHTRATVNRMDTPKVNHRPVAEFLLEAGTFDSEIHSDRLEILFHVGAEFNLTPILHTIDCTLKVRRVLS